MEDLDFGNTIKGFSPGQKVFARYTLTRILGRGGMGVVWLARDEELGRESALKFLPEVVSMDRGAIDDMKREVRRAIDLAHPHIVKIHDFITDGQMAAVSMEYVDGQTLSALRIDQAARCFAPAQIEAWLQQLCGALDYAHHDAEVVHRDLKPANLMVDGKGRLKILDFGIAASLSDSVSRISGQASSSGTPLYMSPQQMMGEDAAITDDIYALGATLYELLAGKPPFHTGNIILQVQSKMPPSMAERRSSLGVTAEPIPARWEETVAACLAKEASARPQSMRELAERLGLDIGRSLRPASSVPKKTAPVVAAPPVQPAEITAPAPSPVVRPTPPPAAPAPRGPQSRAPLYAALAAAALALGGLAWYFSVAVPARQEARRQQEARLEQERKIRTDLLALETEFEGLDKLLPETDRILADLKQQERFPAGADGDNREWVQRRRSLLEQHRGWLVEHLARSPGKSDLRAAREFLQAGDLAGSAAALGRASQLWSQHRGERAERYQEHVGQPLILFALERLQSNPALLRRLLDEEKAAVDRSVAALRQSLAYLDQPDSTPRESDYADKMVPLAALAGDGDKDFLRWKGRLAGNLEVASDPAGVAWRLIRQRPTWHGEPDGEVERGVTPATVKDLPTGRYQLIYSRSGWVDRAEDFEITVGARIARSQAFAEGALRVESVPAGLEFAVTTAQQVVLRGRTPGVLPAVPAGTSRITVRRPEFPDLVESVEIAAGAEKAWQGRFKSGGIQLTMTPEEGSYEITSPALRRQGKGSGLLGDLPVGNYELRAFTAKLQSRTTVTVADGVVTPLRFDLRPARVSLKLQPVDATVRLKNSSGDEYKPGADMPPGDYTIHAERRGYLPKDLAVTIQAGENPAVTVSLPEDLETKEALALWREFAGDNLSAKAEWVHRYSVKVDLDQRTVVLADAITSPKKVDTFSLVASLISPIHTVMAIGSGGDMVMQGGRDGGSYRYVFDRFRRVSPGVYEASGKDIAVRISKQRNRLVLEHIKGGGSLSDLAAALKK